MDKEYRKTRLILTLLYFGIIFVIVFFFSVSLAEEQFGQLEQIGKYQPQRIECLSTYFCTANPDADDFSAFISDLKKNIVVRMVETDVAILVSAIIISYYLSGQTLKPIEENIKKQKEFIANASHELKTPISSIQAEAEILMRNNRTIDEYKEFTKSVLEETHKMSHLASNLLDIAKAEITKHNLKAEKIDIVGEIKEEINKLKSLADKRNIEIILQNKESIYASLDKMRFSQLISILLENAIKYNTDSGKVYIKAEKKDKESIISIRDTGIGIADENLNKVFDRFYRVSEDRNTLGFGLGLSIAKEIVNEFKGNIDIKSKIGHGSIFTVKIKDI